MCVPYTRPDWRCWHRGQDPSNCCPTINVNSSSRCSMQVLPSVPKQLLETNSILSPPHQVSLSLLVRWTRMKAPIWLVKSLQGRILDAPASVQCCLLLAEIVGRFCRHLETGVCFLLEVSFFCTLSLVAFVSQACTSLMEQPFSVLSLRYQETISNLSVMPSYLKFRLVVWSETTFFAARS